MRRGMPECSNPVAITVTWISSVMFGSITAPKIMFTSGWAVSRISAAAWLTSKRVKFGPPVTLNSTPRAPSMVMSSNWLEMACSAAMRARSSPEALPTAINAAPPSLIMVRTSAKSRLIRPGTVMSSEIPWMPWRRTSSAILNDSFRLARLSMICSKRSLGITMRVSA